MIKRMAVFSLASIVFWGCKKSGDEVINTPKTMQTIAGNYKITGILSQYNNGAQTDYYATMTPACEKDNIHHLQVSGSYTLTDAGVVCSPPSFPMSSGWSVANDSMYIGPSAFKIESFDNKTLVIRDKSNVGGGNYLSYTFTYTRQ